MRPTLLLIALVAGGSVTPRTEAWAHPGPRVTIDALSRRADGDDDPRLLLERAAARREVGQLDDAGRDVDRAEAAGAGKDVVALERARIAVARGDDRAAAAALDRALVAGRPDRAAEPSRLLVEALTERASLQVRAGRAEDARSDWDAAFAARPTAEAALARGALDVQLGDPGRAAAGYRDALARVPSVALRRELARVELARGAWDAAIAVVDDALAGSAAPVDWLLLRAEAHAGAGRGARAEADRRDALAEADRALAARPSELRQLARGRALLALGRRDEAAAVAEAVLRTRPRLDEALALVHAPRATPSPARGLAMRFDHVARSLAVVAVCLVASAEASAQQLVRHPYLQRAGADEVTVVWTTDVATDSVVRWGATPDALDEVTTIAGARTQHEVRLTGLAPSTTYHYAVGSSAGTLSGGDGAHQLRTAPPVASPTKFRAWVVGDSGTGNAAQAAVRDAMLAHVGPWGLPELYVHVGDMAYTDGTTDQFTDRFFAPYREILRRVPTFPALGNHEGHSADSATQTGPYYAAYVTPTDGELGGVPSGTEAYYAFDWANVHFIVLDSHDSSRDPDGPMLSWAREDALATDQDWVVAFWHHPPYTKGSHDSDTEGQLIDMRENALPILEAAGVDVVLAGHSHIYERSFLVDGAYDTPTTAAGHVVDAGNGAVLGTGPYRKATGLSSHEGAVYVVAGHGGAGVSGDADHPLMAVSELANGSCLLDVQDNRLSMINVRADGEITDRFTIVKGLAVVVGSPDGGEVLAPGSAIDVRWVTVGGDVTSVDLDLSTDGGASWSPIAEGVANTGTFAWTVPPFPTDQGLLRVRSSDDDGIADESNGTFRIANVPVEVVPWGATWRYRDEGTDLDDTFAAPGTDESSWPEGAAELGYGDDDEATVLLDADPNVPTVYFRHHVDLEHPVLSATLDVLYDDGVAVWVNGAPVFARNVADGADFADFATDSSEDDAMDGGSIPVDAFVVGDNVIAAVVKQADEGSSDVSFDLRLEVVLDLPDPPGSTTTAGAGGAGSTASGGPGSGGATATGSGSTGAAAAAPGGGPGAEGGADDGCGCSVVGAPPARSGHLLALAAALAVAARAGAGGRRPRRFAAARRP